MRKSVIPILLAAVTWFACEEKEVQLRLLEPQIFVQGLSGNQVVQQAGKPVVLSFQLEAAAGLAALDITVNGAAFERVLFTRNEFTSPYNFSFSIPADATLGTVYNFSFELVDKRDRVVTYLLVVRVGDTFEESEEDVNGTPVTRLKGRINGSYTLQASRKYLIDSTFSIEDNGTLTIEAGTQVYFRTTPNPAYVSSLRITRGSRLVAEGTKDNPIVFTSDKLLRGESPLPQDWGGIFLYGNAPTNQGSSVLENGFRYGGSNTSESSGTIRYVRIEYAGKGGQHGIHFFGVGAGTVVENVQVFRCYNIAFRIKGGNVRLKRVAATGYGGYGIWAEHGWRGLGQFWLFHTDVQATLLPVNYWNQARALEMRNDETFFLLTPRTEFQISNVTAIGNGFAEGVASGTRRGVRIRRGAVGALQNTIVTEFPDDAVRVEDLDIAELGVRMVMDNQRTWNNRVNFNNEALTFFFQSGNYNITTQPVVGISRNAFVGSVPSSFNPATWGPWFEPAPFIGAVEEANDWTSDGSWFKNLDGTIR